MLIGVSGGGIGGWVESLGGGIHIHPYGYDTYKVSFLTKYGLNTSVYT